MASNVTVFIGTVGQGIWRSDDSGQTWNRLSAGVYMESDVQALAMYPHSPDIMWSRNVCNRRYSI